MKNIRQYEEGLKADQMKNKYQNDKDEYSGPIIC